MKMIVEKQMECRLAGETEVIGENLPQRETHIYKHKVPKKGRERGEGGG
jgi:hypothetical protein